MQSFNGVGLILVVISVCLSILEGFDRKKRGGISPRGVGDNAHGFNLSPMQFFNGVGLIISGCYKCLFINSCRF